MESTSLVQQIKILCVDDEVNILSSLKRMLSLAGYDVLTANSGDEGLKILQETLVDIIISDMRMPGMNGVQFLQKAKEIKPNAIKLLLTGNADFNDAISAINDGGIFRYLNKPWNDSEFLETIRSSIEVISLRIENQNLLDLTIKQNQELNDLVVNLENKVIERTSDITNANLKLRDSYISSIKAFANLIELRQKKLFIHSKQVADLSLKLAKKMQLSEKDSQDIFIAGLLHDIGKIGLNDRVLFTKITDLPYSDLDEYKEHPIVGSLCLFGLEDLDSIIEIIKHHHERFDGNGFPSQLKGEAIPLGARIVGLAETFFELIEGDLSSAPKSQNDAVKLILKYSNTAFCPSVVDAFAQLFNASTEKAVTQLKSVVDETSLESSNLPNSVMPSADANAQHMILKSKIGSNPVKGLFTYKVLEATVSKYSHALIRDDRDSPDGFLWVVSGVKKFGGNPELDDWLKKNKFLFSEPDSAWYFPYD
jgi:hypothetical protein